MYAYVAESSRASTAPPLPSEIVEEVVQEEDNMLVEGASDVSHPTVMPEDPTDRVDGRSGELKLDQMKDEVTASSTEPLQESKQLPQIDWLDLPMVKKLDSLHTLMEWQFQNPNRLRTQMKDDDEDAQWVILCLVHISQFLIR